MAAILSRPQCVNQWVDWGLMEISLGNYLGQSYIFKIMVCKHLWNITIKLAVGCKNIWVNRCHSGGSLLGEQDQRWNADKPSAALDPYIPTWLTTSPANHRPANFSQTFFFFKHWKEIVKSGAISGWTDEDQF